MKIIVITVAMLFASYFANSQNINDNWVYGNLKMKFNSNSINVTSIPRYFKYGTASISDDDTGSLLFYSDGITVFDRFGNIMDNGEDLLGVATPDSTLDRFYITASLCGGNKTEQGVLIIPKPGSSTNYFVISSVKTIFNDCTDGFPNEYFDFGVKYSEIDISANGGLGSVISKNNFLQATGSKTLVLASKSETSYWLLTLNSGNYNAYLVNSNGISSTPVVSSFSDGVSGFSKVSPDNKLIFNKGTFSLYTLNSNTGVVYNPVQFLPNNSDHDYYLDYSLGPTTLAFSPDSNIIYFISVQPLLRNNRIGGYSSGLSMYNISTSEIVGVNNGQYVFPLDYNSANVQLSTDENVYIIFNNRTVDSGGNIYVEFGNYWAGNYYSFDIGVIENPNNWDPNTNPISTYFSLPLNRKNGYMFPQLIPFFEGCSEDIVINTDVQNGEIDYQEANNSIIASNIIFNEAIADYQANNFVTLALGFNAKTGSDFIAHIQGCGTGNVEKIISPVKKSEKSFTKNEIVNVFPNPVLDKNIFVNSKVNIYEYSLFDHFGDLQLRRKVSNAKDFAIDVNNLKSGIYLLKFIFISGEIVTKKVIINNHF